MEEAREEKQESNHFDENLSNSDEQTDQREIDTSPNSDESGENLKTLYYSELEGNLNEFNPVSGSGDRVTDNTYDCEVCGKEFCSVKSVCRHMRVQSGKKRAAEGEEKSHSLRAKKQASIKFKRPRAPDSRARHHGGSHGGEAWSSSAVERERWSSEREIEVSYPGLVEAPAYQPEPDPVELNVADKNHVDAVNRPPRSQH